jgi:hypothetical protein
MSMDVLHVRDLTRLTDGKPLVLQHFQRVDQALRELLADLQQAPLVLAGARHLQRL